MLKVFKISISIVLMAMMLMLTFIWFRKNDAFLLKSARVYNSQFVSEERILELANIDFGSDIFKINTDEIESRIEEDPMIEKVSVTRFLPSALKIKVREKVLIAAISGSEVAAVELDGDVIDNYPPRAIYDLPVITGLSFHNDSTGIRTPTEPELVKQGATVLNEIRSLDIVLYNEISELHFQNDNGIIFFLKKKNLPVFIGKNSIAQKLNYLSNIYSQLISSSELENVLALDLRYKDQVIVKYK